MKYPRLLKMVASFALVFSAMQSHAVDVASTAKALRLANTITGGTMPTSDPLFQQMVAKVAAGDSLGAAQIATGSKYFANYLARRLAFQMQNPNLDSNSVTDSDATAFVIAHFIGGGGIAPSISSLWSENATYQVNVAGVPTHAAALTAAQLAAVNWMTDLSRIDGQSAKDVTGKTVVAIAPKDVGGYTTLSDRANDNSFAMYGATAGTNLRMIEGIWEISTGLALLDVASSQATVQVVPRFVPEYDPNFFHGQGQPACIGCHGGGMSSLNHGYSTVADTFNFDPTAGFEYIPAPTNATRKSLASDPKLRTVNSTCNLVQNPTAVCNPDSVGVDANLSWNLSETWQSTGVLSKMGWNGATSGQGLNELGANIGKANIVYEFLTKRVIGEVCPMGSFSPAQVSAIAASANPNASPKGTDDIRTIVAKVAIDNSCM